MMTTIRAMEEMGEEEEEEGAENDDEDGDEADDTAKVDAAAALVRVGSH